MPLPQVVLSIHTVPALESSLFQMSVPHETKAVTYSWVEWLLKSENNSLWVRGKKKPHWELWHPFISFPFNNNPAVQERVPQCHFINNRVSKTLSKVFPLFLFHLWQPLRTEDPRKEAKESRQCIAYPHNLIQTVHGMGYCAEYHISKYVKSKPISILNYFLECVCLHLH